MLLGTTLLTTYYFYVLLISHCIWNYLYFWKSQLIKKNCSLRRLVQCFSQLQLELTETLLLPTLYYQLFPPAAPEMQTHKNPLYSTSIKCTGLKLLVANDVLGFGKIPNQSALTNTVKGGTNMTVCSVQTRHCFLSHQKKKHIKKLYIYFIA